MADWWSNMALFEKVFWYLAIPSSVLFLIQMVMTFAGLGGDSGDGGIDAEGGFDVDGDFDADGGDFDEITDITESPFRVFTVRNIIIFFAVFGWSGITLHNSGVGQIPTVLVSTLLGIIVMLAVAGLFYFVTRLTQNGTMNPQNAKGLTGEVYLPIPANRGGIGKIHITFQGAFREMDAVTEGKAIPRGAIVQVIDVLSNNILLVKE